MSTALMYDTLGMEALTPVMIVDMVSTVVMPKSGQEVQIVLMNKGKEGN